MNYLQTILHLDGPDLARMSELPSSGADAYQEILASDDRPLLQAIAAEFRFSAVMTAVSASIATAIETQTRGLLPKTEPEQALAAYAPPAMALFNASLAKMLQHPTLSGIAILLQNFELARGLGQRLSIAQAYDRAGLETGTFADVEALSDAYTDACQAAIEAAKAFERLNGRDRAGHILVAASEVIELLQKAANGQSPCVESDGRIVIPGWAERRRKPRYLTEIAASALFRGEHGRVALVDVSVGGFGLSGLRQFKGLKIGDQISITLPPNRVITGRLTWFAGDKGGIQLDHELSQSDALLRGNTG